jgi:uncharacterized protein YjbI with pentapeptide repeats
LFACVLVAVSIGTASASAAVTHVGACKIEPYTRCSGMDLRGADLSGAQLNGAQLGGADLSGANLRGANLQGAYLKLARFAGANLQGANLSATDMTHASGPHANVSGAGLTGAHMNFAIFPDANFDGSQLDFADLEYLDLTHASLRHANFAGSKLGWARLNYADLHGANFHSAHLHGAQLAGADLRDAMFFHASFSGTRMDHANAAGAKLWPSNLASDPLALNGLYEKIAAHLDAYAPYGRCNDVSYFGSFYGQGSCSAKAQPGGSHGFNDTAWDAVKFFWAGWSGDHTDRKMSVTGTHGVHLAGHCSENWSAFTVTTVEGLNAHPIVVSPGQGAGSPGGPLLLDIRGRDHSFGNQPGYIMFMHGWLLRAPHQLIVPGPRAAR